METRQDGASAAGPREPIILEMTPIQGVPLKEWLGLALTRFALGGVKLGTVVESWMAFPPREVVQESQPSTAHHPEVEADTRAAIKVILEAVVGPKVDVAWVADRILSLPGLSAQPSPAPAAQADGESLTCRQCQWRGKPEDTNPTEDEKDIECPKCGSSMLIEDPDPEEPADSPAPAAQGEAPSFFDLGRMRATLECFDRYAAYERETPGSADAVRAREKMIQNWGHLLAGIGTQPPASSQGMREAVEAPDLRDAVERFLAARDALDAIPDGEAGDVEIGRRAEEAAGHHEDMDAALEDMRAALSRSQEAPAKEGGDRERGN